MYYTDSGIGEIDVLPTDEYEKRPGCLAMALTFGMAAKHGDPRGAAHGDEHPSHRGGQGPRACGFRD